VSERRARATAVAGLVLAVLSNAALVAAYYGNGDPAGIGGTAFDVLNGLLIFNSIACLGFGIATGVLAGRSILGPLPTRQLFVVAIALLSGLSAAVAWLIISDVIVTSQVSTLELKCYIVDGTCQSPPPDFTWLFGPVCAFVLYLIAATSYGFVGQSQGVKVGARTGLLVLLLLAMVPFANILGAAVLLVVAYRRKPVEAASPLPG